MKTEDYDVVLFLDRLVKERTPQNVYQTIERLQTIAREAERALRSVEFCREPFACPHCGEIIEDGVWSWLNHWPEKHPGCQCCPPRQVCMLGSQWSEEAIR
jgi:hypothetical protein